MNLDAILFVARCKNPKKMTIQYNKLLVKWIIKQIKDFPN